MVWSMGNQSEDHSGESAMATSKQFVVKADPRGRVSLARAGELAERYLCYALADGRIILQPAAVVSEVELNLLRDSDAVGRLDEGQRELAEGAVGARSWTRTEPDAEVEPTAAPRTRRNEP
jgi:hypothetical protein